MLTPDEIKRLAVDLESDRVERKRSVDTDKIREAICAFANDMPGHGLPGYVLVGIEDDGAVTGVRVSDELLLKLSSLREDGQIQPIPTMVVDKVDMGGGVSIVVAEVHPAGFPPVRARGRVWIRVGPRRALATPDDERRLRERHVSRARTFDQQPCGGATLEDLTLDTFRTVYLPQAIATDVLAQNERSIEDRLASLRFLDPSSRAPTNAGVLVFGLDPLDFVPGAYIQFTRFDGADLAAPVLDSKRLTGSLLTQLQELDTLLPIQVRTARGPGEGLRHEDVPDYPLQALRELSLNALMHRNYEITNAPVRINWYTDRVEIQNPGGLYGQVTRENFGRVVDYRNPVLAEAMKVLGYVDRYGTGIARSRAELAKNGNPSPEFTFEPSFFQVTIRARP